MFIDFDGIINARELGDIPLPGGKKVKKNRLIRSASLFKASDRDIERLTGEFDLAFVMDFRDEFELKREPDRVVPGAQWFNSPALPPFPAEGFVKRSSEVPDFDARFREVYMDLARNSCAHEAYRLFFDVLLRAEGRGVLWHCTQGKDRTGVAAILLLTALGADMENILSDYFLSNDGLAFLMDAPLPEHMKSWGDETRKKLFTVYPHILGVYLDAIAEDHGSIEGYLRQCIGLGDREFELLRSCYSE